METRVVRIEEGLWHIRTDTGELSESERQKLIAYFDEINLPYSLVDGCLCVPEQVKRDDVFENLENFYEGWANVLPF